ncbi:MAG TPA: TetR/AcrR family transcriptional regulator [Marmoricola sp.]|jgi:AcrR family transcriptional regulator|nr:TetR/AcrR family transcriptional regulator [Marmoricola sp.]
MTDAAPGKAARTRATLRTTALRHFVADGFEAASVTAIAAEAGVTERTFYRHFATKDEVLFADLVEGLAWFRSAIRSRPANEDLIRSVLESLTSAPTDPQLMVEIARLRRELLSQARIERVFRDRQAAMATELRSLLVDRGTPALAAAVRAEALAGAVFAAVAVWSDGDGHDLRTLGALTEQALEQVRPLL